MRRRALLAGLMVVPLVLSGCTAVAGPQAGSTVVIASARSNSAAPAETAELDELLDAGAADGETWTFVSADGRPRITGSVPLASDGENDLVAAADRDALLEQVRHLLTLPAAAPEADVLGGLSLAARTLADHPAPHRIVVVDSLLQTAGALRFPLDDGGLLGADPDQIADRLDRRGDLPRLDGAEVTLIGAGDTAAPQRPLPPATRTSLIALWTTVLERSGATVRVLETPLTGRPPTGLPRVTTVPVPDTEPIPVDRPTVGRLPDSAVGFLPDSTVLRDPAAAAAVLAPYTDALATGRFRAELTGTTSSAGDDAGRLALSRDRAAVVADLLVRGSGVDPGRVTSRGVGTRFPGFVPDRAADGTLDPARAAANRQVIIAMIPLDGRR